MRCRAMLLALVGAMALALAAAAQDRPALEYGPWERLAEQATQAVEAPDTAGAALEGLRRRIVDWRGRFAEEQTANRSRIDLLKTQIAGLGAPPAEGTREAPEIAARRRELNDVLAKLVAPGITAVEAYQRADGLVREIDRVLRDRQAEALLAVSPVPLNPANWPPAAHAIGRAGQTIASEVREAWGSTPRRATARSRLPASMALVLVAAVLIARGRRQIERFVARLQSGGTAEGRDVEATLVSLGQVAVPVLGVWLLVRAVRLSGLVGPAGGQLLSAFVPAGIAVFGARWLALRIFPAGEMPQTVLALSPERRAEGRIWTAALGVILGLLALRQAGIVPVEDVAAANAVLDFPAILLAGVLLFRLGQLLRRPVSHATTSGDALDFQVRIIGLIGSAAMLIGAVAPVAAAVGYVAAAAALVYPAVLSLGLAALLIVLQRLTGDVYAAWRRSSESRDALVPTLIGFGLTFLSVPLFALIWGARVTDLGETWSRFEQGFSVGDTRISPGVFATLAIVFALGYAATRLFQGALRTTILPKTKLDLGGRTALISGVGYIGLFLAALIAITAAGINLSSLAIVAGALSVGIGFGLQNIVSNFVSGIILLIERPVSEGDWIEVGGVMGRVRAISVRSTRIETFDRNDVIVPNADLVSGMVTNWTRFNTTGRLILPVGVAYGSDTRAVERVLRDVAEANPLVILNPPPMVLFMGFGTDALDFEMRVILRDVNNSLGARSELNHEIARALREAGIEIPFAQRDIWLRNPEALRASAG